MTVMLEDPQGKKSFSQPIHIDRIKIAAIREAEPVNFFKVVSHKPKLEMISVACQTENTVEQEIALSEEPGQTQVQDIDHKSVENLVEDGVQLPIEDVAEPTQSDRIQLKEVDNVTPVWKSRPRRNIKQPAKFNDFVLENGSSYLSSTSEKYKVKRVLAQRDSATGSEYLVQLVGEPAQNAKWVQGSGLPVKARKLIRNRPPPKV